MFAVGLVGPANAQFTRRHAVRRAAPTLEPVRTFDWETSTPEEQGLDSGILETAQQEAKSRFYQYSLVVVRHGKLVSEGYYHTALIDTANHIHSASKSFTSAIVGIAIDRGYIHLDDKVFDWFPEYATPTMDPRKRDITVEHLLTMTAGFDWHDALPYFERQAASNNWIRYTLELPLAYPPGAQFNYCTPQTDLLSAIVQKATGMSTRDFAKEYLLDLLGIKYWRWISDPQGYPLGGRAMFFTPRNMARFGYLMLNDGLVDGRRLVPAWWVATSTSRHETPGWNWGALKNDGYGYQWWLGELGGHAIFYASGKGGQFILCFRDLDMVVVTTTDGESWADEWLQIQRTMELVADFVLPAVTDGTVAPPYYPTDVAGVRIQRSASPPEYRNRITWMPDARNAGVSVTGYRIYRMVDGVRSLLAEVDANTFEWESGPATAAPWRDIYAVTTVTDGEESLGAIVSIR